MAYGAIEGANSQTYTPTITGDYYVIITNEFGCISNSSNVFHYVFTGLIEMDENQKVNVYPNPFTGEFTVDYSLNSMSKVTISIFSTYGQKVASFEENAPGSTGNHRITFNTGNFEAGVYFLRIETSDYSIVKRIVRSN